MTTVVRCPRTGRACSEGTCRERHWCRKMLERGLSRRGLPLKRKFRPRCCAKTRAGATAVERISVTPEGFRRFQVTPHNARTPASLDKTARLWDGETGKPIGEPLTGHEGAVVGVAFSPDGK